MVDNNGISRKSVLSNLSLRTLDDLEDYRLPSEVEDVPQAETGPTADGIVVHHQRHPTQKI